MKTGVLGGTFDPVHTGHLILAELARQQLALDQVLFIPAGDPWRKAGLDVTPAAHRVAMVQCAIAGNLAFVLDLREVQRDGPSYTVDTLRELRESGSDGDEIFFILGEDALDDMRFWREPAEIALLARLAVAPRLEAATVPPPLESPAAPPPDFPTIALRMPYIGISATDLRARVREGLSIRYLVPAAVEEYIRTNALYQA